MALNNAFNYKTESNRYNYYYRRLKVFYQKPVTKVSSAVLFSLSTTIFFAVFAIRPTLITISELLRKIEDQKVVLEKAEKKAAALATAQQIYNQISENLYVIDEAVPPDYQIQKLLLSLEASAANLGIPINNLSLDKVKYPIKPANSASIQEVKFVISFDANYPDAKKLISNMSQLPRLVSLDSISFAQAEIERRNTNAEAIQVNLNCRVFYYPERT